jgi:membrane fusion protein
MSTVMQTHELTRSRPAPLFRDQALAAARSQTFGKIVLSRPPSFTLFTGFAVLLAAATVAFLLFGSYTERSRLAGQLISDAGLGKVYAPQAGIVLERHVIEGAAVKAGEVLFVISSERSSASQGPTQAAISGEVRERAASLSSELETTRRLQERERESLALSVSGLQDEFEQLTGEIKSQQDRAQVAEGSAARYRRAYELKVVPIEVEQQKAGELLDQRTRLQALERERIALKQRLTAAKADLSTLPMKQQNQLADIDRRLAETSAELAESEAKRRIVVTAPQASTATAVLANVGQYVDGAKPLVTLMPRGALLHADLYAPSRAMGFVRPGDPVLIRYQAFPYEKFGHQQGTVESVARSALSKNELDAVTIADSTGAEPLYRITVRLASQSIQAYGRAQPLQSGMLLEADVLRETRRLYEWVLEPLYSVAGKL